MEEMSPIKPFASREASRDTVRRGYDLYLLIENIICGLLCLLPVFFLPFTFNAIELNKTYLVMLAAAAGFLLFFIRGLQRKAIRIHSPEAYFGFFVIILAGVLAAFNSQSPRISFLGSNNIYSVSFIYLLALAVLGFISSNIKLNLKKLLNFFALGISLGALISLVSYYAGYVPLIGSVNREFSLANGSMALFGLSVFVVFYSFMSLAGLFASQESGRKFTKIIFYSVIFVLNALCLIVSLNVLSLLVVLFALAFAVISGRIVLPQKNIYCAWVYSYFAFFYDLFCSSQIGLEPAELCSASEALY